MENNFFLKHYDLSTYSKSYRDIKKAYFNNQNISFVLKDVTNYGGVLHASIDNDDYFQVTKKKIRHSDFTALQRGRY
jgi:hypothetical protein